MSKNFNKISIKSKNREINIVEKKVIYLSYIRLTDRVAKTWFIDDLISKNIVVEFWDLISFMREPHSEHYELKSDYLTKIHSLKDLKIRISQESRMRTVFVILFPFNSKTLRVHRMLSEMKVKKVYIDWGAMPIYDQSRNSNFMKKIWNNRKNIKALKNKISRTILRIYQNSPYFEKFDIVFTSGDILEANRLDAQKVIPLAFGDYMDFKQHSGSKNRRARKSAVFLDINLPHQSDLLLASLQQINPTKYYSELDTFFLKLEKKFDLDIVIAAHPKTSNNSKDFHNRSIYRMKTAELVRDAEFVISHQSTSISYAVLNNKPILFIYTDEMVNLYNNSVVAEIDSLAKYFGVNPINISKNFEIQENLIGKVLKNRYDEYIQNYVASKESQSSNSKDVFYGEIMDLLEIRNSAS